MVKKSTLPGLDKAQAELAKRGIDLPPQPTTTMVPKKEAGDKKEESKMRSLCGMSTNFTVGTRQVELHPILVKDWTEFSQNVFILKNPTLYEIFMYDDGPNFLWKVIKMVCREEEVPALFQELTQLDFQRFRNIVLEQNDIDFTELEEKNRKKMEALQSLERLASRKE